ncbi:hypothetical protein [Mycobacterium riyadhense]|uniref:hypothetical protein n=1 Tax=Mycobacterium riyadhense TaxID=486698 RepID=UPI00194EE2AD|nr:hypothetical protein [Mycobacterium riyadhense]
MSNDRIINGVSDAQAAARAAEGVAFLAHNSLIQTRAQAKLQADLDAMVQRRTEEYGEGSEQAESSRRITQCITDISNGKCPEAVMAMPAVRFEKTDKQSESDSARYLHSEAGRKVRWLSSVDQGHPWIMKIIETAIGGEHGFNVGEKVRAGDLIAVRKGEGWKITEEITLEHVIEQIEQIEQTMLEAQCDMEYFAGTADGSCMESHRSMINNLRKLDENPYLVGKDGLRNPYRREYLNENFYTIPFFRGNAIVLARVCRFCLGSFSASNHIDARKLEIIEPKQGFGTVGAGQITKGEYLWDKRVVAHVADEFEARNGRRPTAIELQKALQGAEFIGEGTPEARQFRKDHR